MTLNCSFVPFALPSSSHPFPWIHSPYCQPHASHNFPSYAASFKVNAFALISKRTAPERREFSMSIASVADSCGIALVRALKEEASAERSKEETWAAVAWSLRPGTSPGLSPCLMIMYGSTLFRTFTGGRVLSGYQRLSSSPQSDVNEQDLERK